MKNTDEARRKSDDERDIETIMERNRNEIAEGWAREYADPRSPWHQALMKALERMG